jgi:Ca2+-binding EF-hand superfamily protein
VSLHLTTLDHRPFAEIWLADEELDDIIENFKASDTNGDGKVTREELKNDMKKNKVPEDQIDSLLEQVDVEFTAYLISSEYLYNLTFVADVQNL